MTSTVSSRLGHFLPAALFIAAFALAQAGLATAEPEEWDIEAYDKCIEQGNWPSDCCLVSHGMMSDEVFPRCVAPPAEQVDNSTQPPQQPPAQQQQGGPPPVRSNPTTTTKPVPPTKINPLPAQVG